MSGPRDPAASRDLTGSQLGPYSIRGRLGAGGMGDVYRALDTRLNREVALKILPEAFALDPGRARRFEGEARAASALNHPNIVTVYDAGSVDSLSYIAMELVEGKTLREALFAGSFPIKRFLDVSCQIASGLARAHVAGIVHRDLKPENVMITKDGLAKILDFGLAKLIPTGPADGDGSQLPTETATFPGTVFGTVGYMSPEQAQGQPVDFRTDQFSFGSISYEMLTGKRAFQGKSAVETLAAIINAEPEPIEKASPRVPGPLCWIVERCLAKEPAARYASTQDLAQDLKSAREHLTEISDTSPAAFAAAAPRLPRLFAVLTAAVVLAGLGAAYVLGRRAGERPIPDFQRLTYGHGSVVSARFAPDGRTIVYGAAWDGAPIRLFSTRTDGRDSTAFKFGNADVASVSSLGEIAMLLDRPLEPLRRWDGTLARVSLAGGAPRELTESVACADWSSDGKSLAIARKVGERHRLEFPIGKVLYETTGFIETLRVSPGGDRIALTVRGADVSVDVVDLNGKHSVLSRGWKRQGSVAWSPDGSEVWFTVNDRELRTPLFAVSLSGKLRLMMRLPRWFQLQDVSRDGQALVSITALRSSLIGLSAGETRERDLPSHEVSLVKSMTPDGKTLLFDEGGEGFFHTVYVCPMDGSPAKRLGEGRSLAISSDGQWVVANTKGRGSPLVLLPTGAGDQRALECDGHRVEEAAFFPDGKRLLLLAKDPGHGDRSYVKNLDTGTLRQIAPEGVSCRAVAPDGKQAACTGPQGGGVIYSFEGGAPRPIPGFQGGQEPVLWSSDGRSLFVCAGGFAPLSQGSSLEVFRLDLATGKRELWHAFTPADRAALMSPSYNFAMTPDGKSYAYSFLNVPSDLYLVTGLK